MYFSDVSIKQLNDGHAAIDKKYDDLVAPYLKIRLNNSLASEHAHHGFARRIGILKRCIDNVYEIYPPTREDKPSRDDCLDLTINLQSFIFNVFGSLDNLAWIWATEKQLCDRKGKALSGGKIGFFDHKNNTEIRESFSDEFQNLLRDLEKWHENLKNFRHALAHRIPLYVPPYIVTNTENIREKEIYNEKVDAILRRDWKRVADLEAEEEELGRFIPMMTHSFSEESKSVVFHPQVLADWATIELISEKFIEELLTR
jgi:hypothetical protein